MKRFFMFTALLALPLLLAGCQDASNSGLQKVINSGNVVVQDMVQDLSYDWKDINIMGGKVHRTFTLKNSGPKDLVLKGANTSCMCTTAQLKFTDGKESPVFGMHTPVGQWTRAIKPGESFQVNVTFDPLKHGPKGTGPIRRQVNLFTSAPMGTKYSRAMPIMLVKKGMTGSVTQFQLKGDVLSKEDYIKKHGEESPEAKTKEAVPISLESGEKDHHKASEFSDMPAYEIRSWDVLQKVKAKEDFVLIDVREDFELAEDGTIEGAIHIPLGSISMDTLEAKGISKKDEIVVYCRSGARSRQAYELLNALGFLNVKSMRGGTTHWLEDKKPMVPWTAPTASSDVQTGNKEVVTTGAKISFDRETEDLGIVGLKEVRETVFIVSNTGTEDLEIGKITTSCGCTSAKIATNTIAPGQSAKLTVRFDPTVHEEPKDKFKRTIFLETNDPNIPEAEVTIWVDIQEEKEA